MGTKSTIILVVVLFVVVFFVVSAYFGTLPTITQKIQGGFTQAKTVFQPVVNAWNGLPAIVKNLIMLGIPALFTVFFAWTKSLAVKKMQQTELQAAQQATQLTGELTQAQTAAVTTQNKLNEAETRLAVYEQDGDAVTALKTINTDLQAKLDSLQSQFERYKISTDAELRTKTAEYEKLLAKVTFEDQLVKK